MSTEVIYVPREPHTCVIAHAAKDYPVGTVTECVCGRLFRLGVTAGMDGRPMYGWSRVRWPLAPLCRRLARRAAR